MKDFEEICELIVKNQAQELELFYVGFLTPKYIYIVLDGKEDERIKLDLPSGDRPKEYTRLTNQLEKFKKSLLQNISIERVILTNFNGESFKRLVGIKVPGMQSLSLIQCNGTLENMCHLTDLLSTSHLVSFEYLLRGFEYSFDNIKKPTSEVFDYLASALKTKNNLKKIKLVYSIEHENIPFLAQMISNFRKLTSLDLAESKFPLEKGLSVIGVKELVPLLNHKTLTSLNLKDFAKVDPKCTKEILEILSKNTTLRELNFYGIRFSKDKFYTKCFVVKLLMSKRLAKGLIKNILNFMCDETSINETAYSTYNNFILKSFALQSENQSKSLILKKQKEEETLVNQLSQCSIL